MHRSRQLGYARILTVTTRGSNVLRAQNMRMAREPTDSWVLPHNWGKECALVSWCRRTARSAQLGLTHVSSHFAAMLRVGSSRTALDISSRAFPYSPVSR